MSFDGKNSVPGANHTGDINCPDDLSENDKSNGFDSDELSNEDELEGIRSFRTFESKGVNQLGSR